MSSRRPWRSSRGRPTGACEALAASGTLGRLKSLDRHYAEITDEGAAALAGSQELRHLDRLNLRGSRLTEAGISRPEAAGARVVCESQVGPEDHPDEGISF